MSTVPNTEKYFSLTKIHEINNERTLPCREKKCKSECFVLCVMDTEWTKVEITSRDGYCAYEKRRSRFLQ